MTVLGPYLDELDDDDDEVVGETALNFVLHGVRTAGRRTGQLLLLLRPFT